MKSLERGVKMLWFADDYFILAKSENELGFRISIECHEFFLRKKYYNKIIIVMTTSMTPLSRPFI